MKSKERFEEIRNKKIKFSLRTRLTGLVGIVVLFSILISFKANK